MTEVRYLKRSDVPRSLACLYWKLQDSEISSNSSSSLCPCQLSIFPLPLTMITTLPVPHGWATAPTALLYFQYWQVLFQWGISFQNLNNLKILRAGQFQVKEAGNTFGYLTKIINLMVLSDMRNDFINYIRYLDIIIFSWCRCIPHIVFHHRCSSPSNKRPHNL